ncbi:uncharacterized protein L3040_007458 [Drepanopeziza brunnea f. sp. 'multigermtubi']|uniref:uncharacterized protein n=1 Tax=Drepanopeziza brunnea f. sp. 'multigermtubi' TaxID=698441 RepID=UPI0023997F3A|nr:hypothetical protein L3040_007458 [Drepanopeziza brunnea f. sp. 'multigermtubi']
MDPNPDPDPDPNPNPSLNLDLDLDQESLGGYAEMPNRPQDQNARTSRELPPREEETMESSNLDPEFYSTSTTFTTTTLDPYELVLYPIGILVTLFISVLAIFWTLEPPAYHLFLEIVAQYQYQYQSQYPRQPWMNATTFYSGLIDWLFGHEYWIMLIVQSSATASAFLWLIFRAYKTLRTPAARLIETLGVDVPEAPEVTLAGLKSNACTLQWTKPRPGSQVAKYLIQVNGVNIGESSKNDLPAIEVTGLKPGHFYNIRVIACGMNNFQSGSRVLRISTLTKGGQPYQGNAPPPSSQDGDDDDSDSNDDSQPSRGPVVEIQAASLPESAPVITREHSGGHAGGGSQAGQRRNTGGRKNSPSTAAGAEQAARDLATANQPIESMQQLTEKFETIRKETDLTVLMIAHEREEFDEKYAELERERDSKKQALQERDRASKALKAEVDNSDRLNRVAQNRKAQHEKKLRDEKTKMEKMLGDMARWKQEIENMKKEKESWKDAKRELGKKKEAKVADIKEKIAEQQLVLDAVEKHIQSRGLQIVELEAERRTLPGSEDDEHSLSQEAADKREEMEWQARERQLVAVLNSKSQQLREIEIMTSQQQAVLANLRTSFEMLQVNSMGVNFEPNSAGKAIARRTQTHGGRTSTLSSSVAVYPLLNTAFPIMHTYKHLATAASPNYAPGPFFLTHNDTGLVIEADHMSGMSEEERRMLTADAPLSPGAHSFLPSNLINDDADDDDPLFRNIGASLDTDPQSPHSSSPSPSLFASPLNSSQNLPQYGVPINGYPSGDDMRSMSTAQAGFAIIPEPAAHKSLKDLFRTRGKTVGDSPALGSLKQGQSQSVPRSTEEPESMATKQRRISFSTGWPSFFKGAPASDSSAQGNAPVPARNPSARTRRGFNVFSSSMDEPSVRSERDPGSPRPTSIASSDLPRPSTDSAPFGWGPAPDSLLPNRTSPLATNWSVHATQTWPSIASRRPSFQHGSSSALNTGIASDDDEFLPSSDSLAGQASPSPVGVIGTRSVSSHISTTPKLNPAAPVFKGFSFDFGRTSRSDKDKGKNKIPALDPLQSPDNFLIDSNNVSSPSASRKSRDTHSIHTQNSMAESHEDLDLTVSNGTSDMNTPSGASTKEKETIMRSLLRKGSASKFTISLRGKENGLFSGKKALSSTPSSASGHGDHQGNSFDEFGEDVGPGRSADGVMSSPMLGSGEPKAKDKEGGSGTPKEGRMNLNWGRLGFKKGKVRGSEDTEKSEAEVAGDEA